MRHRDTVRQLVRYGVNGVLLTALNAAVYWLMVRAGAKPQVGNLVGYLLAVAAGYGLHSRVTFRGHGARGRATQIRFFAASLLSYALNAFWVWLLTAHLRLGVSTPLVPIAFVTPVLLFAVNRWWVFR